MNNVCNTLETTQCHNCKFAQREWILNKKGKSGISVIDTCSLNSEYMDNIDNQRCPYYQEGEFSLRELPKD